ncbi:MAG: PHP domain-containing protein [Clostridia bacterium]|nr:PHP domain-containing protein [Clostridia bacterium]
MRKYLLPKDGTFYKANLHCHSTVSDGKLTPEELKKAYTDKGYSIIAYTDHDVLIDQQHLTDDKFLALNGYEMEINEQSAKAFYAKKTCHMCLVALKPDNLTMVCHHRSNKYIFANAVNYADRIKFDESAPDFERHYTPECISEMMKMGIDNGFFVTYNHPGWSMETYEQYSKYENMHAMEICNYGCVVEGYTDYNEKEYDQILQTGKRIYCIATDDNHNRHELDSKRCDSFGGFTMIKADRLEYETITDALLSGNFYASQAPEIHELWFEDGKIFIKCSEAYSVTVNTGRRSTYIKFAENGEKLTEASFEIKPEDIYVRITVTDKNGLHANTNAYFTDELF